MIPLTIDQQRLPQKGDLLLSEPFLNDDHFSRAVILLCETTEEGAFGLILNQTLDLNLLEFMQNIGQFNSLVGIGGPVDQQQLFFVHSFPSLTNSIKISENFYLGGDFKELITKVESGFYSSDEVRFFIGYTGWGEGQLQTEIEEKTWIVTKPPINFSVYNTKDEQLWEMLLKHLGGKYKQMAAFPINPNEN